MLAQAGIPYEIIPGVTSAVAVPAYAGIPLTHREFASAFTVMTGHLWNGREVDWKELPRGGPLVVLMGLVHLAEIAARLVAHGWSLETAVAVIQQGTTASQIVVEGTLQNIADRVLELESPVTIVIGRIVQLRQELDWFDPAGLASNEASGDESLFLQRKSDDAILSSLFQFAGTSHGRRGWRSGC